MLTRRRVVAGGLAVGAAAVLGGGTLVAFRQNYAGWLGEVLARALPGHAIEPEGFELFVREYVARKRAQRAIKLEFYALAESLSNPAPLLPAGLAKNIADEERRIVTEFMMKSDFFLQKPAPRTVVYLGEQTVCNPFAEFES